MNAERLDISELSASLSRSRPDLYLFANSNRRDCESLKMDSFLNMGWGNSGWTAKNNGSIAVLVKASEYYPGFSTGLPLSDPAESLEIRNNVSFDKILALC